MDVDGFITVNEPVWTELNELTNRARRGLGRGRLSTSEVERLVQLYQRTSTHLSYCRTWYGDIAVTARLTTLVGDARSVVYGSSDRTRNSVAEFFTRTFPGRVWESRRFVAIAAVLVLAPAVYVGAWLTFSDAALEAEAPRTVRDAYVGEEFESYYSSAPAAEFSTEVLLNNIQVSFLAYAFGAFACVGTVVVLVNNGLAIGQAGGFFHAAGEAPRFWGLILPHGLLELSAITVAAGAGLRIGWALIAPGDRHRGRALAEEGRRSVPVVLGLVLVFVIAGLIEGFVTPSPLPTTARVGIGVLVEVAFVGYVIAFGRLAGQDRAGDVLV
ncbi:MAG: stage II sporulation protein M [Acidimicrobiales bacterium]